MAFNGYYLLSDIVLKVKKKVVQNKINIPPWFKLDNIVNQVYNWIISHFPFFWLKYENIFSGGGVRHFNRVRVPRHILDCICTELDHFISPACIYPCLYIDRYVIRSESYLLNLSLYPLSTIIIQLSHLKPTSTSCFP